MYRCDHAASRHDADRGITLFSGSWYPRIAALAGVSLRALPAAAHSGHVEPAGLMPGFAHPLGGVDHVLAMPGVGRFAADRRRWPGPCGCWPDRVGSGSVPKVVPKVAQERRTPRSDLKLDCL